MNHHTIRSTLIASSLFCVSFVSGAAHAVSYAITDLGLSGANIAAINNSGQVVLNNSNVGYLWSNGSLTPLGMSTQAHGINNSGQVVGGGPNPSGYDGQAVLWSNGTGYGLGTLGGSGSWAHDINDSGEVVGWARANGEIGSGHHAFISSQDTNGNWVMSNVIGVPMSVNSMARAINNSGQVAGNISGFSTSEAFVASNGSVTYLGTFGGNWSVAYDINNNGQVVGMATLPGSVQRAFLYSNGSMINLGTLSGDSQAHGINDSGQVVGATADGLAAFLYSNGSMQDLNTLAGAAATGWQLQSALDINNNGQIVGLGSYGGQTHAYLLTPVPEPEAYALMLAGLGLIGWRARRRG
jgi:probable HAF family extracellular repeat protein